MKKLISIALSTAVAISLVIGYTPAQAEEKEDVLIGFSLPSNQEERWVLDTAAIQAKCDEYGYELTYAAADNDANKQYDQCMSMLAKGIDVLIIACIDTNAAASIVEECEKVNVPVFAYDRIISGTENLDLYCTFDSIRVGEEQGTYIANKLTEKYGEVKGNIVLLRGSPTDVCSAQYFTGVMNIIGDDIDSGALNVVLEGDCNDWKPEDAAKHAENALSIAAGKGIEIDAILAPNDGTAGGVIGVIGDDIARKTIISGLDGDAAACQRIADGTQTFTVWGDVRELGSAAVDAVKEYLETGSVTTNGIADSTDAAGEPCEIPEILVGVTVLDKDNVDLVVETGYYTHEEVYGN